MSIDIASVLIAFISAAVNIAFLVVLVKQLTVMRTQIKYASDAFVSEQDRIKRQSTLEVLAVTQQYRYERATVMPLEWDALAVKEFLEAVRADKEKRQLLRNYLNYYENLAAGINSGVYDLETVARTFGNVLLNVVGAYQPYIKDVRVELGNKLAYVEMQRLAEKLRPVLREMASDLEVEDGSSSTRDGSNAESHVTSSEPAPAPHL
jgi:Domain of unknown function (DUF4760)